MQEDALAKAMEQADRTSTIQNELKATRMKKKSSISPSKAALRDQLKQQLEIQQQLLRMQQEIFEKANKAQSDIFKLLSELNNDSDEIQEEDSELEEEEEMEQIEDAPQNEEDSMRSSLGNRSKAHSPTAKNTKAIKRIERAKLDTKHELLSPCGTDSAENDETTFVLYVEPGEEDEGQAEETQAPRQYIPEADVIDVPLQVIEDNPELFENPSDDGIMVLVQNENEESEAYELIEVYEPNASQKQPDDDDQIHFEIVDGDSEENIRCRVVPAKNKPAQKPEKKAVKAPIKVLTDLDAIPLPAIVKKEKPEEEVSINKVLNRARLSEKEAKDFIQKMVHEAKPDEEGKFRCTLCSEVVSNRYSLGPHIIRVHSKQRSKICPYCDRAFACTGDLTRHIRIHTNSKPFKCTFDGCDQAFRASGDLHKHMRRHEQSTEVVKCHVCDMCNRGFERNYDLNRHKLTHNKHEEGVGFSCELCSMVFVRKVRCELFAGITNTTFAIPHSTGSVQGAYLQTLGDKALPVPRLRPAVWGFLQLLETYQAKCLPERRAHRHYPERKIRVRHLQEALHIQGGHEAPCSEVLAKEFQNNWKAGKQI